MNDWEYKPASDVGLPAPERWRSLRREAGLPSTMAHAAWCGVTRAYLALWHRFCVTGLENLPAKPPFVVVANHTSHLDAIALAAALPRRLRLHAFPIAAGDTFFETRATAAFAAIFLNALPMWRKSCGAHAMETLRARIVADDLIYLLFPEGTRSRTGEMGKFRAGIGMLVAGTNVPVVPARLDGCFAAMPPDARFPKARPITLRFGAPQSFSATANDRPGWQSIADALRAGVDALA